ncbi:hypothetical protein GEMRC1_000136 [Eukaryota sp. GEM-RC1]
MYLHSFHNQSSIRVVPCNNQYLLFSIIPSTETLRPCFSHNDTLLDQSRSYQSHVQFMSFHSDPVHNSDINVDILVLYTPAARRYCEQTASSIDGYIHFAWSVSDESFRGVGVFPNYVHWQETDYTEVDTLTDLLRLTFHESFDPDLREHSTGGYFLEEAHSLRDLYSADLVILLTYHDGWADASGRAWVLSNWNGNDARAFGVVDIQAFDHDLLFDVFDHELGHLFGCGHNSRQEDFPGPNNWLAHYAAGWNWNVAGRSRRSIMAYPWGYSSGKNYESSLLFSSPSIFDTVSGQSVATGDDFLADNARVIKTTRIPISKYRIPLHTVLNLPLATRLSLTDDRPWFGQSAIVPLGAENAISSSHLLSWEDSLLALQLTIPCVITFDWKFNGLHNDRLILINGSTNVLTQYGPTDWKHMEQTFDAYRQRTVWIGFVHQTRDVIDAKRDRRAFVGNFEYRSAFIIEFSSNDFEEVQFSAPTRQVVGAGSSSTSQRAIPPAGHSFVHWSLNNQVYSFLNPLQIHDVQSDMLLVPSFQLQSFTIDFVVRGSGNVEGQTSQAVFFGHYASTVIARDSLDYVFSLWECSTSDSYSKYSRELTFGPVASDVSCVAVFEPKTVRIEFRVSNDQCGSIQGEKVQYISRHGSSSPVSVLVNDGCYFTCWNDGGRTSPRIIESVESHKLLIAEIEPVYFYVHSRSSQGVSTYRTDAVRWQDSSPTIRANPRPGHTFQSWDCSFNRNPDFPDVYDPDFQCLTKSEDYFRNVSSDIYVDANFVEITSSGFILPSMIMTIILSLSLMVLVYL